MFFTDTIAYAAPTYSSVNNLAAESRLKPFFAKQGLSFENRFAVVAAAARLRDLNSTRGIRKSDVMNLNKVFPDDAVYIDPDIRKVRLKSTGRVYKYATFYLGDDKKPIQVSFIKDHESLKDEELEELGVKTEEDRGYFFSRSLPKLEGVWFAGVETLNDVSRGEQTRSYETPVPSAKKPSEVRRSGKPVLKKERPSRADLPRSILDPPATSPGKSVPHFGGTASVLPELLSEDREQAERVLEALAKNMPAGAMSQITEFTKRVFIEKVGHTKGADFYVDVTKIPIAGTDTVVWVCQPPYGGNFTLIEYGTPKRSYTLIDTGMGHYYQDITEWLRDQGVDPGQIEKIVMLHSHPDHNGAAGYWQEDFPHIPVIAHPGWESVFDADDPVRGEALKLLSEVTEAKKPEQVLPFDPSALSVIQIGPKVFDVVGKISAGALEFQVLSFPAHTRDSVVLVEFSEKMIIVAEFLVDPEFIMDKQRLDFLRDSVRLYSDYGVHEQGNMTFAKDNLRLRKQSTHRIEIYGHGGPQQRDDDDIFGLLPQVRVRKGQNFLNSDPAQIAPGAGNGSWETSDAAGVTLVEDIKGGMAEFAEMSGKETTGSTQIKEVLSEVEKIHAENLKYTPTIAPKTILCHVVTDSILPVGQRGILKSALEQNMRGSEYREKIAVLSIPETAGIEEFMAEFERVKERVRRENKGYKVEFTVACPNREGLVEKLQERDIDALYFSRKGEEGIVQVEGILMALRALHAGRVDSLISVYRFLTGNDVELMSGDVKGLARMLIFTMPVRKVDLATEREINRIMRENILTAA